MSKINDNFSSFIIILKIRTYKFENINIVTGLMLLNLWSKYLLYLLNLIYIYRKIDKWKLKFFPTSQCTLKKS